LFVTVIFFYNLCTVLSALDFSISGIHENE
jgi:hypothetical protein